uniref:NADH dehydrogenase subunit 6 n=1 Tax=Arge aurora TaxID=2728854 RepID=A0A6M5U9P3_9HYME|nr:NADH dehydrogenase subunit 6 [Arge aurora]
MKIILISLMMTFNIIFCMYKHPMTLAINLMLQLTILIILMNSINFSSWFSYIMFLIMVGALLVLFMYMTSLTSNMKFKYNYYMMWFFIIFFLMTYMMIFNKDILIMFLKNFSEESYKFTKEIINNLDNKEAFMLSPMYDKLEKILTILLINYLLYVLIIVVKIVNIKKGTMRKMN